MSLKDAGVDITELPSCVLPYGTGNDFAKISNWGSTASNHIYSNVDALVRELADNTTIKDVNVWSIQIKLNDENGDIFQIDSRTRQL